jgi:outer membrane protein TolC
MKLRIHLFTYIGLLSSAVFGQEVLGKQQAIALALEQNFGILMSKNNLEIANNNKSIFNSGYLPILSSNAGANYNGANSTIAFPGQYLEDGSPRPNLIIADAESQRYNAGVNLNYTLFDGLGRMYTYKGLKEQYALSELQLRTTIEQTILQLFSVYYRVAQLSESEQIYKKALEISKNRKQRADLAFSYGQSNKLAVLNAEVDVTNDSIDLLQIQLQKSNVMRDLNLLLNQSMDQSYVVDTEVQFLSDVAFINSDSALLNNVEWLKAERNEKLNEYDLKVARSGYLPSLGLVGSYGWNLNQSADSAFFPGTDNSSYATAVAANLSWNLFDGGRTLTRSKNAKMNLANSQLERAQVRRTFERDFENAKQNYKTSMRIYEIQQQQVKTSAYNFDRTQAQYELGTITAVEYRQAQLNLRNAQNQWTTAKYQVKLAELQLLQLSGDLLNVDF